MYWCYINSDRVDDIAYQSGKGIIELKNQIIPLAYYAGLTHEQIEELKKKHNVK